jgi:secreted PhoX family phosphatase
VGRSALVRCTGIDDATRGTADSQARAFGDNTDGMDVFSHDGKTLLVVNNEYTNRDIIALSAEDKRIMAEDDIAKGMMAHGISVVEIANDGGAWKIVKDSPYNRRITPQSEMELTGPAAGHDLMKTEADPTGTKSLGTWNNCGNGVTPWGTYLTCEENFNGYFSSSEEVSGSEACKYHSGIGPLRHQQRRLGLQLGRN